MSPLDSYLSLDLANTAPGTTDLLSSPGDLGRWLDAAGPWLGAVPPEVSLRLADFRRLREAVRALLGAVAGGRPVPSEAVERVNAASEAVPVHRSLDAADPLAPAAVETGVGGSPAAEALATIARSAIEVVGTAVRDRVRACEAPRCGRFFVASRPDRRWCSEACGNRARVARHHARRRTALRQGPGPAGTRR